MTVLLVIAFFATFILIDWMITRRALARDAAAAPSVSASLEPVWVSGYRLPEDLHYHQGHVWVRPLDARTALVGLDDFARGLIGTARGVRVPALGDWLQQGGSGFGVMAMLVAVERGWIARQDACDRLARMARFLLRANSYHGILPHFLNGETGRTIPFTRKDDGADLVETSFLIQGLLCARQYFDRDEPPERELRVRINRLWEEAEWRWHTRDGSNVLYWHWSPNNGWSMNAEIHGWNECLITYVLAASAPRYGVDAEIYHRGWAMGREFRNSRDFHGVRLPLGPDGRTHLFPPEIP